MNICYFLLAVTVSLTSVLAQNGFESGGLAPRPTFGKPAATSAVKSNAIPPPAVAQFPAPSVAVNASSMSIPIAPAAVSDDYILAPGDLIDVTVFQEPDLESKLRISQDGVVIFPLIGRVQIGGLTPQAAGKLIQENLGKDYLVNPHVNLTVSEYTKRRFTVLGQVQKPGSYDMPDRDNVPLLEAIGMAGGYTRIADPSHITVKRRTSDKESVIRLNGKKMAGGGTTSAFEVLPGDIINVGESLF